VVPLAAEAVLMLRLELVVHVHPAQCRVTMAATVLLPRESTVGAAVVVLERLEVMRPLVLTAVLVVRAFRRQ
jgi:hypothetical protein